MKIKITHAYAIELARALSEELNIKFTAECGIGETYVVTEEELTKTGKKHVASFINAFQSGLNAVNSVLDEIQEHAQLISSKINRI